MDSILTFNNTYSGLLSDRPRYYTAIPTCVADVQHLSETVPDRIEAIIEPEKWYIG